MNWLTDTTQQKMVDLGKGLFCIRYEDAEDQASPPRVVVKPASGHERSVELLLHPDSHDSTLWGPGTSLVVRTTSAAKLQVEVVPSRPNGSRVASVRVEPLTQGAPPRTGYGTSAGSEFGFESAAFDGLRLVGLRLAIQSSTVAAGHPLVGDESEIAARSDQRYPAASTKGKVRVFRSRPPLSLAAT